MQTPKVSFHVNNEPLYYDAERKAILVSQATRLVWIHENGRRENGIKWAKSWKEKLLGNWAIFRRVLRLGVHSIYPFLDGFLRVENKKVIYSNSGFSEEWTFSSFKGSRPLNLGISPDGFACFGEYFSNADRGEVRVFGTNDGVNWREVWKFKAAEIRHVHGCIYDEYRNGFWVLTGDSDDESGLYFTGDHFATLIKEGTGSQQYRAVEVIPGPGGIIVPMDSPSERNWIQHFDPTNKSLNPLCEINSSAFHAIRLGGIDFVSTVTEPSPVNDEDHACVYASMNGTDWKLIAKFKRDFFPTKYQKYFRYAEIRFIETKGNATQLIAHGRALKGLSSGMMTWNLDEIKTFLSA
ncbi:MAG: hypothetical protein GC180_09270 [Bacteroidetes bacterium]|nr:hypothetical protein [Bacteroidota bacterium]